MVETVAGPHFSAERGRLTRDRVYSSAIVCPAFLNTRWYGMEWCVSCLEHVCALFEPQYGAYLFLKFVGRYDDTCLGIRCWSCWGWC